MPQLSIEELTGRFPDFRVAFLFAEPLRIAPRRSAALASAIPAAEADCRRRWAAWSSRPLPKSREVWRRLGGERPEFRIRKIQVPRWP